MTPCKLDWARMGDNIGTRVIQPFSVQVSRDNTRCSRGQKLSQSRRRNVEADMAGGRIGSSHGLAPDRERRRERVREVPGCPAKHGIVGLTPVTTSWAKCCGRWGLFVGDMGAQDEVAQAWSDGALSAQSRPFSAADVAGRGGGSLLLHTHQHGGGGDGTPHTRDRLPRWASQLQLHLYQLRLGGMIAGYLHSTVPHKLLTQQPCPHAPSGPSEREDTTTWPPYSGIRNR